MKNTIKFAALVLCVAFAAGAAACGGGGDTAAEKPRIELSSLSAVYDGEAHYPETTIVPSDLSDVELTFYRDGQRVSEMVYPGEYKVVAVVKNKKIEDAEAQFVIAPAAIELKDVVLPDKVFDGSTDYSATIGDLPGTVGKDRVSLVVEGRLATAAVGQKVKLAVTKIELLGDHAGYYSLAKIDALYVDITEKTN